MALPSPSCSGQRLWFYSWVLSSSHTQTQSSNKSWSEVCRDTIFLTVQTRKCCSEWVLPSLPCCPVPPEMTDHRPPHNRQLVASTAHPGPCSRPKVSTHSNCLSIPTSHFKYLYHLLPLLDTSHWSFPLQLTPPQATGHSDLDYYNSLHTGLFIPFLLHKATGITRITNALLSFPCSKSFHNFPSDLKLKSLSIAFNPTWRASVYATEWMNEWMNITLEL